MLIQNEEDPEIHEDDAVLFGIPVIETISREAKIKNALSYVKEDQMSLKKAAKEAGVPYSALQRFSFFIITIIYLLLCIFIFIIF